MRVTDENQYIELDKNGRKYEFCPSGLNLKGHGLRNIRKHGSVHDFQGDYHRPPEAWPPANFAEKG